MTKIRNHSLDNLANTLSKHLGWLFKNTLNVQQMDLVSFRMFCLLLFALVWKSKHAIHKMGINSTEYWNLIDNDFGLVIIFPSIGSFRFFHKQTYSLESLIWMMREKIKQGKSFGESLSFNRFQFVLLCVLLVHWRLRWDIRKQTAAVTNGQLLWVINHQHFSLSQWDIYFRKILSS